MEHIKKILDQTDVALKAMEQLKILNEGFNAHLESSIKAASGDDKEKIKDFQAITERVMKLAKEGKTEEAQNLIKQYQDASNNH